MTSRERVSKAFDHRLPDRTPLFEIFQSYHPIHWNICGRNVATDQAMAWDAMADGIAWEELFEANILAQFTISRYFGLDMVRLTGSPGPNYKRPLKTGETTWTLNGTRYHQHPKTKLVVLEKPGEEAAYSHRFTEEQTRKELEEWDGSCPSQGRGDDPTVAGVRKLAEAEGIDWVYMGEVGAGTGAAFYPPFLLMWMIEAPDLFRRYIEKQKLPGLARTRQMIESGCTVIAMGGDVSCDKGPFISPAHYREFILPVIQEHVNLIHDMGAKAVYTSDGNHWPIRDEFFFDSRADGYKEVDNAAGMTWPRLIDEGVAERICIIGNLDARYTLCLGTAEDVRAEVIECLKFGQQTPGGHILHASHSVHEDVKAENYHAVVDAYRDFFGMEKPGK
jgi:hypothetical protein